MCPECGKDCGRSDNLRLNRTWVHHEEKSHRWLSATTAASLVVLPIIRPIRIRYDTILVLNRSKDPDTDMIPILQGFKNPCPHSKLRENLLFVMEKYAYFDNL